MSSKQVPKARSPVSDLRLKTTSARKVITQREERNRDISPTWRLPSTQAIGWMAEAVVGLTGRRSMQSLITEERLRKAELGKALEYVPSTGCP